MLGIILCFMIGLTQSSGQPQSFTGTLRTDIVTGGGDCVHRWWLKVDIPDAPGRKKLPLVALEPEDKVPPELNNRHVRVVGQPKSCHGVENSNFPVIEVESIRPVEESSANADP
jgi:hypothetical protein